MVDEDLAAATDRWWHQRIQDMKAEYRTTDMFKVPKNVWHAAQQEYAERMSAAHGRNPRTREREYVPVVAAKRQAVKETAGPTQRQLAQSIMDRLKGEA